MGMPDQKYKLVTRSDMDGLISAILLKQLDMIDEIQFVHPRDVQDGTIKMDDRCITTNLPYNPAVHMAFDHHSSEVQRVQGERNNRVIMPEAPSAARVVYEHFGGKTAFPNVSDDMMAAVDKADSAQFTYEDVINPQGWELLSFLMDARTGLGRFREFRISNYSLMMELIDYCINHSIRQVLELPDVKERVDLFFAQQLLFKQQILRCTAMHSKLAVLDLRGEETIYAGNRFMIYALFPTSTISMHVMWGREKQNTVFAAGKSIFNRTSTVNLGELMLAHGGGGHLAAATCQVPNDQSEAVKAELIAKLAEGS
jgi:nanoRNase/pAp phosphatase (c-di-AMP/oligoRNAs hydrolase)